MVNIYSIIVYWDIKAITSIGNQNVFLKKIIIINYITVI